MNNEVFESVVTVVLPGGHVAVYVVQQSEEQTEVSCAVQGDTPPAAPALLLSQLLSEILPTGLAGFHAWKSYSALRVDFTEVNSQMANVPAISEDELPF